MCTQEHACTCVCIYTVVVVQLLSHVWLCDSMDCSTPGFPVLHHLLALTQTYVHWVGEAIQPSHALLPSSPFAFDRQTFIWCFLLEQSNKGGAGTPAGQVWGSEVEAVGWRRSLRPRLIVTCSEPSEGLQASEWCWMDPWPSLPSSLFRTRVMLGPLFGSTQHGVFS